MKAEGLLDELASLGVHLVRDGDAIFADVEDGADISVYVDCIREQKPELLTALELRDRIVTAASADPGQFSHDELDRLWSLWNARVAVTESDK